MSHNTVTEMLAAWDAGETIWSVELGGLGPGYEQAIQVAAVEFARAGKDMPRTGDDTKDGEAFNAICTKRLRELDDSFGGLSGAQYGAAMWLAWQWCFNGGPARLMERAKEQGKDDDTIQVSNTWPRLLGQEPPQRETSFDEWWDEVGSSLAPLADEDREDHVRRVAQAAVDAAISKPGPDISNLEDIFG